MHIVGAMGEGSEAEQSHAAHPKGTLWAPGSPSGQGYQEVLRVEPLS